MKPAFTAIIQPHARNGRIIPTDQRTFTRLIAAGLREGTRPRRKACARAGRPPFEIALGERTDTTRNTGQSRRVERCNLAFNQPVFLFALAIRERVKVGHEIPNSADRISGDRSTNRLPNRRLTGRGWRRSQRSGRQRSKARPGVIVRSRTTANERQRVKPRFRRILDKIAENGAAVRPSLIKLSAVIRPTFLQLGPVVSPFFRPVLQLPFTLLLGSSHVIGVLLVGLFFCGLILESTPGDTSDRGNEEIQELTNLLCFGFRHALALGLRSLLSREHEIREKEQTSDNPSLELSRERRIDRHSAGQGRRR
ncbi:hypothetical protein AGR6A_Cc80154 [Agrobacterium sp. NCPPB 925]|nr:hypothetical protein AGR6A_Cc80154 [Agrobacterium sp. NCPPB 925]